MSEHLKYPIGKRILFFLIIALICGSIAIAISAVSLFVGDTGMKIAQGLSSIFMFVVPPIVYYYITREKHPMQSLGFRKPANPWWLLLIGVALMFISMPVTNQLTRWNEAMSLSTSIEKLDKYLKMLEDILKTMEQNAAETIEKMLKVDTIGGLLFNLVVIALIPAIGEELTFRGVLQQSLTRSLKNPHWAIILSAAIFSYIHFQFYGFLPRMFLGILLGYMFYITGSLWTSMAMHFVNNGTAVVVYYLNNTGAINVDVDHFGEAQSAWLVVASAVVTAALIAWSWWRVNNTKKGDD